MSDAVHAVENAVLDFVLVDGLKDVGCADQDGRRSDHRRRQKDVHLQTVDDHRDIAPVFEHLHVHASLLHLQPCIVNSAVQRWAPRVMLTSPGPEHYPREGTVLHGVTMWVCLSVGLTRLRPRAQNRVMSLPSESVRIILNLCSVLQFRGGGLPCCA